MDEYRCAGTGDTVVRLQALMTEPASDRPIDEHGLLDSLPDLVYRYRLVPTPGFEYVSPSSTEIIGYTPEDHYADPDLGRQIVHPDDLPILLEAVERPDPDAVYKIRWRHKNGQELLTEQRLRPIYDRDGDLVAIVGVSRPVSPKRDDRLVSIGDLSVDLVASRAFVAGRTVELTTSEHRILASLASADREVSREALVEQLWGTYHAGGERALQVHVSNLRRKLDPDRTGRDRIETVPRRGLPVTRRAPLRAPQARQGATGDSTGATDQRGRDDLR